MKILIDTIPFDEHASALKWALEKRGHQVKLFFASDFPAQARISVAFGQGTQVHVRSHLGDLSDETFDVGILRRRRGVGLAPDTHEGDKEFAEKQSLAVADVISDLFKVRGLWINDPRTRIRSNSKLLQLSFAQEAGFVIPKTIVTNDPEMVRQFCSDLEGAVALKPLQPAVWTPRAGPPLLSFTSRLDPADLQHRADSIRKAPSIYQEYLAKDHELRVFFMGHSYFAAKLFSQDHQENAEDWRLQYVTRRRIRIERVSLPAEVIASCHHLMRSLGIVTGSFDFIVSPDGVISFLEVNPMGQFLWLDSHPEFPLLSAFCDFVESSDAEFQWVDSGKEDLRFAAFYRSEYYNQLYKDVYPKSVATPRPFTYAE